MIWLTRGKRPTLNRDTGQYADGTYGSKIQGPDNLSDSALNFTGTQGLFLPLTRTISGNFTIQFGFKITPTP